MGAPDRTPARSRLQDRTSGVPNGNPLSSEVTTP
jgi:hypothetical protein